MNSLRDIVESSPQLRSLRSQSLRSEEPPQPLAPARWDWQTVERVLVVRLRSIGDTVLSTPSLFALKRFLPHASVDILLEDWVAPVLDGFPHVDNVITLERKSTSSRASCPPSPRQSLRRRLQLARRHNGNSSHPRYGRKASRRSSDISIRAPA